MGTELTTLAGSTHDDVMGLGVWRRGFLVALALTGNVSAACRAVNVSRFTAYLARKTDSAFADEWAEAIEDATDALEEEARKRAMGEGVSYKFDKKGQPLRHPITGEPYAERCVSDALLILLLKAHRPEKYKDRSEVTATVTPRTEYDLGKLTNDELQALRDLQRKALPDASAAE